MLLGCSLLAQAHFLRVFELLVILFFEGGGGNDLDVGYHRKAKVFFFCGSRTRLGSGLHPLFRLFVGVELGSHAIVQKAEAEPKMHFKVVHVVGGQVVDCQLFIGAAHLQAEQAEEVTPVFGPLELGNVPLALVRPFLRIELHALGALELLFVEELGHLSRDCHVARSDRAPAGALLHLRQALEQLSPTRVGLEIHPVNYEVLVVATGSHHLLIDSRLAKNNPIRLRVNKVLLSAIGVPKLVSAE